MGEKNGKSKMNSYLIFCILHPGHLPSVCLWSAESGEEGGEEHTAQVMTGPYHQPNKRKFGGLLLLGKMLKIPSTK